MYFQRLRDMREDNDLTQENLAKKLGIIQTVYSRYERGYQTIPLEHLIKLAELYDVSVDYLLGRTDKVGRSTGYQASMLSKKVCGLPPKEQRRILEVVDLMIRQAQEEEQK